MYTVISLGGSLVIPKTGFNIPFLKKFRKLILDEIRRSRRFILIVGGGATARIYQEALRNLEVPKQVRDDRKMDNKLDWMGIYATMINTQLVRLLFGEHAYEQIGTNPTKKIKTAKPVIVGAGWKPGCSSDYDAVLAAKTYGAREVINISNIDYIYDKDPTKFKKIKPIPRISWRDYRAMVGNKWYPGSNAPFDPIASKAADKLGLAVKILRGTDLPEVRKAIRGEKFRGTTIA
ncbi:MAG: UMP kinase [Candidatus Magasanikbacteria bacterium]|nr:UMP kinase [Candidatus Magasanikbacteria bacterium]